MTSCRAFVAIVDDDESIRRSLKRLLVGTGFEVEIFASGTEFLASLETRSPDGVVLDMYMPEMNGLEVQAHIRRNGLLIPVVFITAHENANLRARALAAGAAAYLEKPVRKEILLAALSKALGNARPAAPES